MDHGGRAKRPRRRSNDSALELLALEVYSLRSAAELLKVPASTLQWWLEGRAKDGYAPVLRPEPTGNKYLTWGEFIEAAYLREYRAKDVKLYRLRQFIGALRDQLGTPYPLATYQPFIAPGRRLVIAIEREMELDPDLLMIVEVPGGQLLLTHPAESFLERVEFADGAVQHAVRWFPLGKNSPVVVDPEMKSGAPTIRGIRTEALAELADTGMPLEAIAEDYGLEERQLKQALAYEWQRSYEPRAA